MKGRKIIAAMQMSLDGLIEGPEGEIDWVGSWSDSFDLLPQIDTCILGGGMYPGYEQYWLGVLASPDSPSPLTGQVPMKEEVAYAQIAERTPHVVVSTRLSKVTLKSARIVDDLEAIRRLKAEPGKDMYAVGGATLVSSLMNEGLVDQIRLTVHPIVLGRGKAMFKDVEDRHSMRLLKAAPLRSGELSLVYQLESGPQSVA
jgi:dihydrofolate reductase